MSINGHFNKITPAPRMPKSDRHTPDKLGFHWNGRVLNGVLSSMEALQMDALAVRLRPDGPYGEPDAVLRYHTRTQK